MSSLRVIGDSHVNPEIWEEIAPGISTISYPGFKVEQILQFEMFENNEQIMMIAGSNDQLYYDELIELYDKVAAEYQDNDFTFVLPFYLYKAFSVAETDSKKYNLCAYNPDIDDYQDDRVHLTDQGQRKFISFLLSI